MPESFIINRAALAAPGDDLAVVAALV